MEASALPAEPTPGDMDIEKPEVAPGFGLPASDDPDPFGVKALEKEGLEIKVAGTRSSPSMEAFEYKPSPSSPIYGNFRRHSVDSARRNSKRSSLRSIGSIDRGTQTTDLEMSPTKDKYSESKTTSPTVHTPADITEDVDGERDQQEVYEDNHDIVEAVPEAAAPVITKARLVTIPKRIPPSLPPRNPHRNSPLTESTDSGESPHDPRQADVGLAVRTQDHTTNGIAQVSKGPELDETMDKTHFSSRPSATNYHNTQDPERLAPAKDISDEVSISGSDYSRETPIAMKDNEHDEPGKKSVEVMYERGGNMSEEFMSVPSTPLEATSPAFQGEKVMHKATM